MDSGVPLTPSFIATSPMKFNHYPLILPCLLTWILVLDSGAWRLLFPRLHLIGVMSLNRLSLWGVGISPLTDPFLAMLFQEPVLKWVVILLITPHPCILHLPCMFFRTLFPMMGPHISLGMSYKEHYFYGSGYPLHGTPSKRGNIYPHLNNPYHTFISSQNSVMMPV